MNEEIRVGVSTCLLGENVRYDGGHKRDRYIQDTLGAFFELVPVCPEHEAGLGVPREPMRLVGDPEDPRLVTIRTGRDHTALMKRWAAQRSEELASEGLCGFIFKSKSPSSGMERVKVYNDKGTPVKRGVGLFARAMKERFPLLPMEEEGRLHDPGLRESFIERVFVVHRWRGLLAEGGSRGALVTFHTRHKLLIRSHGLEHYRELGRLVAAAKELDREELLERYHGTLMRGLALKATAKKHSDVLHHCLGYFKKQLTSDEKQEVLELVERYKAGHVPLIVPVTLINHFVRKYDQPYLKEQVYLNPHPHELRLRNHV